ncbi:Histone-lysine N-methyltransferase SETMAR [Habropoda laboriosa]|uniref:Histone-lysine N-methyltransferase SETMAR n=1 Tax=Habropoda laboriosa TaxID=597456 RepID=A0A0L7RA03_9HYME|nr:Histone-lysine N-methyltransferase SETMAR [Habropoda laboriosa]
MQQQLEVMHQKLRTKQSALINQKGPILLHDNAQPHVSQITAQTLNYMKYETLLHPSYSSDLLSMYFFKHLLCGAGMKTSGRNAGQIGLSP